MAAAPFASTIVAVASLIPVAVFFVHAFISGKRKNRFHPVTRILAVTWDLTVSIGYMMYRTIGGNVSGETLQLTPLLNAYFMIVHVPIAILVMSLEIAVFALGIWQLRKRTANRWHTIQQQAHQDGAKANFGQPPPCFQQPTFPSALFS